MRSFRQKVSKRRRMLTTSFFHRGGPDSPPRGQPAVPQVLADDLPGVPRGGAEGTLPRHGHAALQADPQHRHHDGHLRVRRLRALQESF